MMCRRAAEGEKIDANNYLAAGRRREASSRPPFSRRDTEAVPLIVGRRDVRATLLKA